MNSFTGWISSHTLELLLAAGAVFTFLWLLRCKKRLRLGWAAALALSVLHTVIGVAAVSLFAIIEGLGDRSSVGNMSLFGAVFFMPFFYWAVARLTKRSVADVFDVFTVCLVFTLMCARINCILSGCCQGAHIPISGLEHLRWPTRELEIVFYLVLLVLLCRKVLAEKNRGQIYPIYMMSYGVFRFITETFRASESPTLFHIAHLWAMTALCIGASVYFEMRKKKKKARR